MSAKLDSEGAEGSTFIERILWRDGWRISPWAQRHGIVTEIVGLNNQTLIVFVGELGSVGIIGKIEFLTPQFLHPQPKDNRSFAFRGFGRGFARGEVFLL
jgi:hypothetical protein